MRDIVAEPIHHNRLSETASETSRIAGDLLEVVALGAAAGAKFPHEFSEGHAQRAAVRTGRDGSLVRSTPRSLHPEVDQPDAQLVASIWRAQRGPLW